MKDLSDIMRQAQQMQQRLQEAQDKMEQLTAEGSSGAGMVKVTLKGSELGVYVGNMSTPKFTRVDTNFTRGQIGVRSFQCDAQFDNVTFSNAVSLSLKLNRSLKEIASAIQK